jgi:hypothetical protein
MIERPRSPDRTRVSQARYWRWSGWSSPNCRRICWAVSALASAAWYTIISTGSPGSRRISRNTMTLVSSRTGTVASSRRAT